MQVVLWRSGNEASGRHAERAVQAAAAAVWGERPCPGSFQFKSFGLNQQLSIEIISSPLLVCV